MTRWRFEGQIYGVGTASGTRIVIGNWQRSPLGSFADVMIEFPDGNRLLLAPSETVRDFVTATYTFDETAIVPFALTTSGRVHELSAGELRARIDVGAPTVLGRLLQLVPRALATAPWFSAITDPIARVVLRGVRTRGTAGGGRREYYGASAQHRVDGVSASWRGDDLGELRPIEPPVRFGFGSVPTAPSVTTITTTIDADSI
ncbi:hypothetical protein [Antrihabitans spumae]|uniref:Uncharacterized protein n=1 Tax=Antrihabitans spumae TaxID=3373370 RepID=A0ABW7JWK1_9NOCA